MSKGSTEQFDEYTFLTTEDKLAFSKKLMLALLKEDYVAAFEIEIQAEILNARRSAPGVT